MMCQKQKRLAAHSENVSAIHVIEIKWFRWFFGGRGPAALHDVLETKGVSDE